MPPHPSPALESLEYVPGFSEKLRAMKRTVLELGLFGGASAAIVYGIWSSVSARPASSPLYWGSVIVGGALLGVAAVFIWSALAAGPVVVSGGMLRLASPATRPDGRGARTVSLFEIAKVSPAFGPSGEDGVDVTLVDSTGFFLARHLMGHTGTELLERICNAHQTSFLVGMHELIRQGYLVATLKVDRRIGEAVILNVPIFTYSGEWLSRLNPEKVAHIRAIETRQSGPMYEVELLDGTTRLMSLADAKRIGLVESKVWGAKLAA